MNKTILENNKEIKDINNRITYLKWKIQFLTDQQEIKIDKYIG